MAFSDPSNIPSAEQVNQAHTNSDVDKSRLSQHHTLGTSATQASPGNHNHDGISSVKIKATNLEGGTTGYYGAFSSFTDQTAANTTTAYPMIFDQTDEANGVTIALNGSSQKTRITFANTGTYNVQWSGQFESTDTSIHDVTVWLRKNGVDVAGSAGLIAVLNSHGGVHGHALPAWNYILSVAANDYLEFYWSTTSTNISIQHYIAGTSPTRPVTAALILTVQQVMNLGGAGATPIGLAGGDLTGTYPNPTIAAGVIVDADVNASAAIAQSKISGLTTSLAGKANLTTDNTFTNNTNTLAATTGATRLNIKAGPTQSTSDLVSVQNNGSTSHLRISSIADINGSIVSGSYPITNGIMTGHNPEGKLTPNPMLINDIAFARLRGSTFTFTGLTPINADIDAMFNASSTFWNVAAGSFPASQVIQFTSPVTLTYGAFFGISFGNSGWAVRDITLEAFSEGVWKTVNSTTSNSNEVFMGAIPSNAAVGTTQFRITLATPLGAAVRITHIFAYNFASPLAKQIYLGRDGGTMFGDVQGASKLIGFGFGRFGSDIAFTDSTALKVTPSAATNIGTIIRGATSQTADLQQWQTFNGTTATTVAKMTSAGILRASQLLSLNGLASMGEFNNGAIYEFVRATGTSYSPGANRATMYFRDGTTAGTLKLVTRAGTAGVEETLFDNLDQTGTSNIAIGNSGTLPTGSSTASLFAGSSTTGTSQTINLGTGTFSTASQTINIGTGASASSATRVINIGTSALSTGTTTTTINGTLNASLGKKVIQTVALSGTSAISFTSIPAGYRDLEIRILATTAVTTSGTLTLTVNGLTTNIYNTVHQYVNGVSPSSITYAQQSAATSANLTPSTFGAQASSSLTYKLNDYTSGSFKNGTIVHLGGPSSGTYFHGTGALFVKSTAAITQIDIAVGGTGGITGSAVLIGVY